MSTAKTVLDAAMASVLALVRSGPNFDGRENDLHRAMGDHNGMTLRDYFAAKAMAAMIAQYPCQAIDNEDGGRLIDNDALTGDAYDMADAMMAARERA